MFREQPAQIAALIRAGRMIHIGGRPVIVLKTNVPETQTKTTAPASRNDRGDGLKLALAFAAIYLVWGSTYLAIRYAVETIPPLVTAGIRHSVAGTILLAWAWARGYRPTRAHWISGFILGALFFLIGHGSLHWAEQHVASGLAALLIATEPMFILVLAWWRASRRSAGSARWAWDWAWPASRFLPASSCLPRTRAWLALRPCSLARCRGQRAW